MKRNDFEIEKNLCDLEHDSYLQKSHTIINISVALWLALIAILATWLIEGDHEISAGFIIFSLTATSVLVALGFMWYLPSKIRRKEIFYKINRLRKF